jgi:hypothetical protein
MVKSSESVEGNVTESQDDVKVVKKKLVLERKVVTGLKAQTGLRAGRLTNSSPHCPYG